MSRLTSWINTVKKKQNTSAMSFLYPSGWIILTRNSSVNSLQLVDSSLSRNFLGCCDHFTTGSHKTTLHQMLACHVGLYSGLFLVCKLGENLPVETFQDRSRVLLRQVEPLSCLVSVVTGSGRCKVKLSSVQDVRIRFYFLINHQ